MLQPSTVLRRREHWKANAINRRKELRERRKQYQRHHIDALKARIKGLEHQDEDIKRSSQRQQRQAG